MNRREFALCGMGASVYGLVPAAVRGQVPSGGGQATDPAALDPFALVDPELLAAVKGTTQTPMTAEGVAEAQKAAASISANLPSVPGVRIARRSIPGPAGAPEVSVVIAETAPEKKNKPALLHIHGGGYVVGAAVAFLPGVLRYAVPAGCVVVSVDYRLAPGTRFPGSL